MVLHAKYDQAAHCYKYVQSGCVIETSQPHGGDRVGAVYTTTTHVEYAFEHMLFDSDRHWFCLGFTYDSINTVRMFVCLPPFLTSMRHASISFKPLPLCACYIRSVAYNLLRFAAHTPNQHMSSGPRVLGA